MSLEKIACPLCKGDFQECAHTYRDAINGANEKIDAQAAEIELLRQALEDKANGADEWQLKVNMQVAEIERLRVVLDEIAAKALKESEFPSDLITSYDMRRIADIARAARGDK